MCSVLTVKNAVSSFNDISRSDCVILSMVFRWFTPPPTHLGLFHSIHCFAPDLKQQGENKSPNTIDSRDLASYYPAIIDKKYFSDKGADHHLAILSER